MIYSSMYLSHAYQTLDWCPMDTEALYNKNMKENFSTLKKYEWDQKKVTYKFNDFGFRGNNFSSNPSIMFIGCSHTFGIGINYEDTFGYHVAKELKLDYINLGQGGMSNDACFRLSYYWIDRLKPKIVFLLATHEDRFEIIHDKNIVYTVYPNNSNTDLFYKVWISSEGNSLLNKQKNILAIQSICNMQSIKFSYLDYSSLLDINLDLGRDLCHAGIKTNKQFSKKVLEKLSY